MIITQLCDIFRTIIIMSISGSVLILLLFAIKPLIRNYIPKSAQYKLWLVTLAALLIPVSKLNILPKVPPNIIIKSYDNMVGRSIPTAEGYKDIYPQTVSTSDTHTHTTAVPAVEPVKNTVFTINTVFLFIFFMVGYILGVLILLMYNIISYIHFTNKVRQRRTRARMEEIYELVRLCGDSIAPRLYRCDIATTPMLIGIFNPEIILPDREYTTTQLINILQHELIHLRRKDIIVKWLTVLAITIHWFNPLVWLARREIDRICELSCDEAVIRNLSQSDKQNYGETLITIAASNKTPRTVLSTTMYEGKEMLKERLLSIKKSQKCTGLTLVLSVVIIIVAVFIVCFTGTGTAMPTDESNLEPVVESRNIGKGDQSFVYQNNHDTESNNDYGTGIQDEDQHSKIKDVPQPADADDVIYDVEPVKTSVDTSIESTLPSTDTEVKQDQEYFKLLRENGVNVSTEDEFMAALETANIIIVKNNMTLGAPIIELKNINVLVIDEGVTLKITTPNFYADCKIVNFGEILIADHGADHGRMLFSFEPDYTMLGKVRTEGRNNEISFSIAIDRKDAADDIAYFLHPNSIYTTLNITGYSSVGELAEIIINKDITIPAGKTLWINYNSVLRVNEGVNLTNNGTIICYNQPIVEGKISGIGKQMVYRQ